MCGGAGALLEQLLAVHQISNLHIYIYQLQPLLVFGYATACRLDAHSMHLLMQEVWMAVRVLECQGGNHQALHDSGARLVCVAATWIQEVQRDLLPQCNLQGLLQLARHHNLPHHSCTF